MAVPPPTTLTFQMSADFILEATGKAGGQTGTDYTGVWAYLWNDQPPSGESNFTTLIDAGQLTGGTLDATTGTYTVTIDLTNATTTTVNGGTLYLLLQSEALGAPTTPGGPPTHANDLTTLITSEGLIEPNVSTWQYGYSQFEYSLLGKGGDAGDLTAIPGFSMNTQVHVQYSDGTNQYRGYGQSSETAVTALDNGSTSTPNVLTYAGGQLAGSTMMVVSPSNQPLGGGSLYPVSNWTDYVTQGFASQYDLLLSGSTNGENDANGVWHNAQYFSYDIQAVQLDSGTWGAAGQYFVFSPKAGSQTAAWMVISESDLQSNLYSAGQGKLYIYEDAYLTKPYTVPGSGSPPGSVDATYVTPGGTNDEFGNVLTQAFTGFTAGYWATVASQANPFNDGAYGPTNLAATPLNLNNNTNWDAAYAFDYHRDTALSPIPTYIHNDGYSEYFFYNSNVYGSAFSDNLSVDITPGPLIPLGQPGATGTKPSNNVGNIDFYVYGSQETAPNYTPPTGGPYLAPATTQTDYLIPNVAAASLYLNVVGRDGQVLLRPDLGVQLGIYTGKDANGHGQFEYVTLPTNGNIWQTYTFSGSAGAWSVTGGTNTLGTFGIAGLPVASTVAEGDIGWYQLVLTDGSGHQKVYEFYTTAASTTPGDIQSTIFDVAVAGGANINPNNLGTNFLEIDLNEYRSAPLEMLTFAYAGGVSLTQPAAAPVVGTLSGGSFTALDQQNGTGMPSQGGGNVPASAAPSLTITDSTPLAFGWTGTNNGTHTGTPTNSVVNSSGAIVSWGLISQYTNQIVPGHIAQVVITQTGPGATFSSVLQATPDLDGRWQTTTTATLGNGTYSVTLQELLADGVTPYGPPSAALTLTVTGVAATGAIDDTAANISADLDTYGANLPTTLTISDNEALTVTVGQIAGDAGALAVAQNADSSAYQLIVQDKAGNVAAALTALSGNTHLQQIEFTDAGASILSITYAQYTDTHNSAAIDKMVGAHSFLMSVTGQAYSSMAYDYNDRTELTGVEYFHTGVTGQAYTGYVAEYDGSNRLTDQTFTGVTGQAYHTYSYEYAAGYAATLPNNGLIGQTYYFANVQGQAYTNYEHDLNAAGLTTRIFYSGVKTQPYSSYEDDYIINSTGSHLSGQKYYFTDIVGRTYTGHEQDLDANGGLVKDIFTGGLVSGTQVYSSWEYDYASGNGVLTGQKYYQTGITGQAYTGYAVELDATSKKIAEVWSGITSQAYSSYEYDYANGDGVVTGSKYYFDNVQNQLYSTYQHNLDASGAEILKILNNNDGSHTLIGFGQSQTIQSIFNDTTTGGGGADIFVYKPFFGQATLTDFNATEGDKISLSTSEFANYAYLQNHNAVVSGNLLITGANGDTLTLQHLTVLPGQSDFLFV